MVKHSILINVWHICSRELDFILLKQEHSSRASGFKLTDEVVLERAIVFEMSNLKSIN